jgi:hypothetical protein
MLLSFKEQIIEDFQIPSFNLNEGEIVILEIRNIAKSYDLSTKLIEIFTEMNSKFIYVEHIKQNSFIYKLFPLTVEKYLRNCDKNSIYKNKIYEIDWIKPKTKIDIIAGNNRRLLALYKTLTFKKNIIIDFVGCDPQGSIDIYKILKENQKENGTTILFDYFNGFKNENAKHIQIEYIGSKKNSLKS